MKFPFRASLLALFFIPYFLFADGPPIDTSGRIRTSNYIPIALDSAQLQHLQYSRYLELNSGQWERLCFLNLPHYVDVCDPFYRDCTCGMTYCMWFTPNQVAFTYYDTTQTVEWMEQDEELDYYQNHYPTGNHPNNFFISPDAQLFYMGKVISPDAVPTIVTNIQKQKEQNSWATVYLPPYMGTSYEQRINSLRKRLEQTFPPGFSVWWM